MIDLTNYNDWMSLDQFGRLRPFQRRLGVLLTSLAALAAVILCFGHLSLGERLLVARNVLVYGHLDP